MRISKIELTNFKRFTSLTISNLPDTSRLVLVIGSNGSGKSSLFDAFDWLKKKDINQMILFGINKNINVIISEYDRYYKKDTNKSAEVCIEFTDGNLFRKENNFIKEGNEFTKKFIGRSSIRIVPKISNTGNVNHISTDEDSPLTYIENDTRFINDVLSYIQQIDNALREPVFSGKQADTLKIFRDFIEPLNNSLLKIFGGDENTTIQIAEFQNASLQSAAQLIFKKGEFKINYDLLSHGEKQVVILLINFIVRKEFYKDAIIFIDEMDNHLNTALQYTLLEEIVANWIPADAQLWTATHALGFIDYARKSDIASIIDFNLLNFDIKQEIIPQTKDDLDVYEIAIPKATIASILRGYKLVIVENRNDEYYNAALGSESYLFLPANNNREVFLTVKADKDKLGLRDRDYLREDEIQRITERMPNLKILSLYTFENYIYHPDNISELGIKGFNKEEYIEEITRQKNEKLIDLVSEIGIARTHYIEFKDCIENDKNLKPLIDALRSNNFHDFYPCFNMKSHFNRKFLTLLNIPTLNLAKTTWFKTQIKKP